MPPIVLFIISLNLCLSLSCLWLGWKILQWRKSLIQINQGLTIAALSLRNRPQLSSNPAFQNLQTQVQQVHSQLQSQLLPLLQFLSATYRIQRLWARTGQKFRSPSFQRSSINPRRR